MMLDPDEAIAAVEADIERTRVRVQRMGEVRQAMESVTGEAISRNKEIAVAVDLSGAFLSLKLTRKALDLHHEDLAEDIMALHAQACQRAKEASMARAAEILGDDPILTTLNQQMNPTPGVSR